VREGNIFGGISDELGPDGTDILEGAAKWVK